MLIKNARIVNEGTVEISDLRIKGSRIERIGKNLDSLPGEEVIDATGKFLIPGAIDDQVHFREPGLTHKGEIYTESRAAVAGGITSFMEMPNTVPNVLTQELLQDKYDIAARNSLANYSFYMGASNDNLAEVLKTDPKSVCGIKVFMGSSTGNMLVDNEEVLDGIFKNAPMMVATHCEDEATIRKNTSDFKVKFGEAPPFDVHPMIRSSEACYLSSSFAVNLAKKHGTRLHILHLSTAEEMELFDNSIPLEEKKITAEACVHHLWFDDSQYKEKGAFIKWNPAVKKASDREAIRQAVKDGRIDVIATDHAPHTLEEKQNTYFKAPSGGPLVQHAVVAIMELVKQGVFSIEEMVQKMCHNPAILFQIKERGYIREGYFADLVLIDPDQTWEVNKENVFYKCGWSPFEGTAFSSKIVSTWVSGHLAYHNGAFNNEKAGERLYFDR